MASQERTILSDFLLSPASLRDVITLRQFTDIFPANQRSNPAIKDLYREIYNLRKDDIEIVRENIADEVKASKQLRREYRKARRQDEHANVAGLNLVELETEQELSESNQHRKPHTLPTIHASIEDACGNLEIEITEMETDIDKALEELKVAIGDLSDLRYGQLSKAATGKGDLSDEVLATLKTLEGACTTSAG
ncbi:Cnl2/NKP2 family protein-domain-containing protein [Lophiotrema nucula]|uniref:Cnl2/NKP2 family protein-domain-containing protein n=1 Tax=Lophiotrema nucula TaxID=690887 RepID=A0A6A5YM23_9PLEO|nr:Cnl2/NKP2 family protein-domain-containing protein [Lophiotrema nucula]